MKTIYIHNPWLASWAAGRLAGIAVGVMLSIVLFLANPGMAGSDLSESIAAGQNRVEIRLTGANEFSLVQLFEYLLVKVDGVTKVEPIRMQIVADDPQQCSARWNVETDGGESFDLVSQLLAIIKELDPNVQNKVLYESPFIVTEEDLGRIKETESVSIGPRTALFSLLPAIGERPENDISPAIGLTPGNRWHGVPGAGFD